MKAKVIALMLAASAGLIGTCNAQSYPSQSVTITVPFPPGGLFDSIGRMVGKYLQNELGQPVVIENRGGAGGTIGTAYVTRQKNDGYSLLLIGPSLVTGIEANRVLQRPALYQLDDLVPVARIANDSDVVLVNASSPWQKLEDMVKAAKQKPGDFSFSSTGVYSNDHLSIEMLSKALGVDLLHVPYQGGAPAMTAMLAGDVNVAIQAPSTALPYVSEGKAKALVSLGSKRAKGFPDTPTLQELGYEWSRDTWVTLFAPAGTPPAVIDKLSDAVKQATENPELLELLDKRGVTAAYLDGPQFSAVLAKDASLISAAINDIGVVE